MLVADAAMDEQDGHVDDIEIRQQVVKPTGQAVGQRSHQVSGVVHVTGQPPEAGDHELAVVLLTVSRRVRTFDEFRLLAPDDAVAVGAPEQVFLMVGHPEDVVPNEPQQKYCCRSCC